MKGPKAGKASAFPVVGILTGAMICAPTAEARSFLRVTKSGVPLRVWTYHSWTKECDDNSGVVRVVTKPQHGKLKPVRDVSPVQAARNPADPCRGTVLKGFQVVYTSAPGYRGMDSFVVEFTSPRVRTPIVDEFTMHVE